MSYNIEEAANYVRALYPGMGYDDKEDNALVSWYINKKNPEFGSQLNEKINLENKYIHDTQNRSDFKYTSFKAPSDTGMPESVKNFTYSAVSMVATAAPEIANQMNAMIDPEMNLKSLEEQIRNAEEALANPAAYYQKHLDSMKFIPFNKAMAQEEIAPNSWRARMEGGDREQGKYVPTIPSLDELKENLPALREKREVLSRIVNREDPDADDSTYDLVYGVTMESMYQLQNNFLNSGHGTETVSKWMRETVDEALNYWPEQDEEFQAYLQWSADMDDLDIGFAETIGLGGNFGNFDLAFRAISSTMGSLAGIGLGPGILKAPFKFIPGRGAWTSGKKIKTLASSFGDNQGLSTAIMWGGEGSEITRDLTDYLINDYEFEVPEANDRTFEVRDQSGRRRYMQKGIPESEAFVIAGQTTPYALVPIVLLEKLQYDSIAKGLKVNKAFTKSITRAVADNLLDAAGYKVQKKFSYNLIANIGDAGLSTFENAMQEGYQQGVSFLTTEAFKRGYDVNTIYGMNNLLEDARVRGNEIGWGNFLKPWSSEIAQVKSSFTTSLAGFGGPNVLKVGAGAISDRRSISKGETAINWENLNKMANNVRNNPEHYELTIDPDKNNWIKVTDKRTGEEEIEIVPDNTANNIQSIINQDYDTGSINGVEDAFNLILAQATRGGNAPTIKNLIKGKKLDSKNPIHALLISMAKDKQTNQEYSLGKKVFTLFNKSKDLSLKYINDRIAKEKSGSEGHKALIRLKTSLAKELQDKAINNIKSKKSETNTLTPDGADKAIDQFMKDSNELNIDDVIYKHESGDLERHIANSLNKNLDIDFDIDFENAIDNQINNTDELDRYEDKIVDDNLNALNDKNLSELQSDKINQYVDGDKAKDINHPDATEESIMNVLGTIYIDAMQSGKSREESRQAVLDYLTGKEGQRMYATNFFKVLDYIGSSYPSGKKKKENIVNNTKKRESYFKQIASYLSEDINPAPIKTKKKKISTKKKKVSPVNRKKSTTKQDIDKKQAALDQAAEAEAAIDDQLETISQANQQELKDDTVEVTIMGETETMTRAEAEKRLAALQKTEASDAEEAGAEAAGMENMETAEEIRGLAEALLTYTTKKKDDTEAIETNLADVSAEDTVKPVGIEDMIEDTVTEYSAEEDAPVSQIDDLLSDTLEEAADQGEAVTFMNEKEMKDTVSELDVDSEIVQDNKENVSKETSKKTQKRINRLNCPNRGV